jgi:hypothetical protein
MYSRLCETSVFLSTCKIYLECLVMSRASTNHINSFETLIHCRRESQSFYCRVMNAIRWRPENTKCIHFSSTDDTHQFEMLKISENYGIPLLLGIHFPCATFLLRKLAQASQFWLVLVFRKCMVRISAGTATTLTEFHCTFPPGECRYSTLKQATATSFPTQNHTTIGPYKIRATLMKNLFL